MPNPPPDPTPHGAELPRPWWVQLFRAGALVSALGFLVFYTLHSAGKITLFAQSSSAGGGASVPPAAHAPPAPPPAPALTPYEILGGDASLWADPLARQSAPKVVYLAPGDAPPPPAVPAPPQLTLSTPDQFQSISVLKSGGAPLHFSRATEDSPPPPGSAIASPPPSPSRLPAMPPALRGAFDNYGEPVKLTAPLRLGEYRVLALLIANDQPEIARLKVWEQEPSGRIVRAQPAWTMPATKAPAFHIVREAESFEIGEALKRLIFPGGRAPLRMDVRGVAAPPASPAPVSTPAPPPVQIKPSPSVPGAALAPGDQTGTLSLAGTSTAPATTPPAPPARGELLAAWLPLRVAWDYWGGGGFQYRVTAEARVLAGTDVVVLPLSNRPPEIEGGPDAPTDWQRAEPKLMPGSKAAVYIVTISPVQLLMMRRLLQWDNPPVMQRPLGEESVSLIEFLPRASSGLPLDVLATPAVMPGARLEPPQTPEPPPTLMYGSKVLSAAGGIVGYQNPLKLRAKLERKLAELKRAVLYWDAAVSAPAPPPPSTAP